MDRLLVFMNNYIGIRFCPRELEEFSKRFPNGTIAIEDSRGNILAIYTPEWIQKCLTPPDKDFKGD